MPIFHIPLEKENKSETIHPWAKTIKDIYANKITRAHNSIKNIEYPLPKVKHATPESQRITFTVIGIRVTKDFLYCCKLVRGMHKYRADIFNAPIIRGVTTVEWPKVLQDLKIKYGGNTHCLLCPVAVLYNGQFLGGDIELKELIETKYCYHIVANYHKDAIKEFYNFVKSSNRACVYMHISIDNQKIGTLIFMLYSDIVPRTCENFLTRCKEKKGGYSGTPVHRIVKDGWIQCGGFGLKEVPLDCENFIVPHDKRGVLAMCNAARHVECSTQFFVSLQPMEWMQQKYVAFGQLIDGEETLKKIENVPTFYESPTKKIIIFDAGILNLESQDIAINKSAVTYIEGHIDDLTVIGQIFAEILLERLWLELEFKELMKHEGEAEVEGENADTTKDITETKRFIRKKSELREQYEKAKADVFQEKMRLSVISQSNKQKDAAPKPVIPKTIEENKEHDATYEPEEYSYSQVTPSPVEPPKKLFYIQLQDVPYPGEVDSNYDLKRFLQGHYCLEADLDKHPKRMIYHELEKYELEANVISEIMNSYVGTMFLEDSEDSSDVTSESLDSDEEAEIKNYLAEYGEKASFSGARVKKIATKYITKNPIVEKKNSIFTDEELRRMFMALQDMKYRENKKVSISVEPWETHKQIKRRQTGFVKPIDYHKIRELSFTEDTITEDEKAFERKVDIAVPDEVETPSRKIKRRQTGYVRPTDVLPIPDDDYHRDRTSSDAGDREGSIEYQFDEKLKVRIAPKEMTQTHEVQSSIRRGQSVGFNKEPQEIQQGRPSVLVRLYEDVAMDSDDELPTLKDYRPKEDKNKLMLSMSLEGIKGNLLKRSENVFRNSADSIEHFPTPRRKSVLDRRISTDFSSKIDKFETAGRSKSNRPTLSVKEYKRQNQMREDDLATKVTQAIKKKRGVGLRLPGDTPLYNSATSTHEAERLFANNK